MSTDLATQWREEWLSQARPKIPSWEQLASRESTFGINGQSFWRALPGRMGSFPDDALVSAGILRKFDRKLYHIAHIPWRLGRNMGKEHWAEEDWALLSKYIEWQCSQKQHLLNQFIFDSLTIKSHTADLLIRSGLRKSHIIGPLDLGSLPEIKGNGNLFDGNLSGVTYDIKDATITGKIYCGRSLKASNSKINSIDFSAQGSEYGLEIEESHIASLRVINGSSNMLIKNSIIERANLDGSIIGSLKIYSDKNDKIGISMSDCNIKGRMVFDGIEIESISPTDPDQYGFGFDHTRFEQSIRIFNCNFNISILSGAKIDSQIDIDFKGQNIEDVYEEELIGIIGEMKLDVVAGEGRRKRLERACQLICERHRQDGRKDLEQRFRRMELKARAYRADADRDTRIITWCYSFFLILEEA